MNSNASDARRNVAYTAITTGFKTDGRLQDVSGDVKYEVANPAIACQSRQLVKASAWSSPISSTSSAAGSAARNSRKVSTVSEWRSTRSRR